MLPQPSTSAFSSRHRLRILQFYVNRLFGLQGSDTNLAVWLLAGSLLLSFALNFRLWSASSTIASNYVESSLPKGRFPSHLVIVAGHAVWKVPSTVHSITIHFQGCYGSEWNVEDNWVLHSYQTGNNSSVQTFYTHILKGAELLGSDPSAVLLFSGGITRPSRPFQSEAQSYLALAMQTTLQPHLLPRVFTEGHALDSFQNLLFAIMRYHELAIAAMDLTSGTKPNTKPTRVKGRLLPPPRLQRRSLWPEKITVVGLEMKRSRFFELHRAALRWPEDRFQYIGLGFTNGLKREQAEEGEKQYGYQPYTRDLYGCTGELALKRASRNPFARFHSYYSTSPELAALLGWCPTATGRRYDTIQSQIFSGPLPWD